MKDCKRFWTSETQMYYERECIIHGEGCYLYDEKGNKYLDANSGTWNVFLGHGNKRLAYEMDRQLRKLDYVSNHLFFHEQGDILANRLISLFPSGVFDSVFFTSGGAEAVDTAIKMAKQYWYNMNNNGKNRMISLFESYHGSTIGAVGVSGDPWDRKPFDSIISDSIHIYPQYCYQCRLGLNKSICSFACLNDLRYKIDFYGPENICALIIEPVMGVGGTIIPDYEYLKKLVDLCHQNDILVIFDEISSGMGRCGAYFVCLKYNIFPDILLFGKIISNGAIPLAGVVINHSISDAFSAPDMSRQFRHGYTNSGHPVSCAVGNCVMDIFEEEKIIEKCVQKSEIFKKHLDKFKEHDYVGEIRIIGLMIAIELINPKDSSPLVIPNLDIVFRNEGILLSQMTQVIGLMPAVVMSEPQFVYILETIDKVISRYLKEH